jgi:predicted DsbA family dithiol-disulfide isomerase
VRVEVWADVVCPWCALGHHRLREAIRLEGVQAEIVHRAFELDPGRTASEPSSAMLRKKHGPAADGMMAHVRAVAAADGLTLRPEQAIAANTFDAHRLALWGGPQMLATLFEAHFVRGLDLGDREVLAGLADGAAGLLASDAFAGQVRADEAEAHGLGVRGVPFFVVDRAFAVSGAQPVEVLRGLLRRAAA